MAYGVTPTGYLRKDLATIISELETAWKGIYGDNLNVSAASPAGQIIGITAAMLSDAWEEAQNTFDAYNPDAAAGVALSNLVQVNGIERRLASASTVLLTLTMSGAGTLTVPAGSIVSDVNGIQWTTDSSASRSGSGTITGVAATCTETGPTTALSGTITTMVTNVSGWTGVTNPAAATPGLNEETDFELRFRRAQSVSAAGSQTVQSIIAGLWQVDDVTKQKVLVNDTNATDADGINPHTLRCVVKGGTTADVARVIYDFKPLGTSTQGGSSLSFPYLGYGYYATTIYFSRPTEKPVYLVITRVTDSNYPVDGDQMIRNALKAHFDALEIGDEVRVSRLYTPINSVAGHYVSALTLGFSAAPVGVTDLTLAYNELATITADSTYIVIN